MINKIIPVIHIVNWNQTRYNVDLCVNNGIDMVFLIDHGNSGEEPVSQLINFTENVNKLYPNLWVGCNFLQLSTQEAMVRANNLNHSLGAKINGLWADNAHISIDEPNLLEANLIAANKIDGLYFGGVAFKYQKQPKPEDLKWVCENAINYMDVITTSGSATGQPADLNKIKTIRSYIGEHLLAIASGVNAQNKNTYFEYVNYLLVASSITHRGSELIDEAKLKELINA